MVPASQPFLAYVFYPRDPGPWTPSTALFGGAYKSAPHWIHIKVHSTEFALGQVQVSGMAIEKQAHAMGKTKYLYSGLAFIGVIRHFA